MINYGDIESEIVEVLNAYFQASNLSDKFIAALFPESEQQFNDFRKQLNKSRAAVQFVDSTPLPSQSIDIVQQEEIVKFRVSFEGRSLRGEGGVYRMQGLVKKALIGKKLNNAVNRITYAKYDLLAFEQNVWQPYYEFECKFINIQAFNDNPDELPLVPGGQNLSQTQSNA